MEKINKLNYTHAVHAGDFFFLHNDLPADTCVGEREVSNREIVDKLNEIAEKVNKLIEEKEE